MPNASGSSSSRRSSAQRGSSSSNRSAPKRGGSAPKRGGSAPKRGGPKSSSPRGPSNDQSRGGRSSDRRDSGDGRRDSRDSRGGSRGKDSRGGPRGNSSGRSGSGGSGSGGYQGRKRRDETPRTPARAETSGWGSVAQHGAAGATVGQRMFEQEAEERFSPDERRKFQERQARRDKIVARNDGLREQAREAIDRGGLPEIEQPTTGEIVTVERRTLKGRPPRPMNVEREMTRVAGKEKGPRGWRLLKRAAKEYQNEQFHDSRKTVLPLIEMYPNVPDLHELHGLSLYRLGRWEDAIESLEMFRQLTGTPEQNPVLMDCHRAVGNWADVDELWAELGELSPSADLVTEGRIVMAGSQADRGFIDSGVRTLEKGWKIPKEPMDHHLRRAYALADLLERDGKLPKSRKLFAWVADKDPTFGDALERSS